MPDIFDTIESSGAKQDIFDQIQPKESMTFGRFMTQPISKSLTGQSIGERTDFLNKKGQLLVDESDIRSQLDLQRQAMSGARPIIEPKTPSFGSMFMRQLPAATGQAMVEMADVSPTDVAVMAATGGAGKMPIFGTTAGRIASTTPFGKGFVSGAKELGRYEQTLKAMAPLSARAPVSKAVSGGVTSSSSQKLEKQATDIYRDILRPTQGEVKNIEVKQGRDINKYYRLAAEEGLEIRKTSDNKLDTSSAVESLKPKIQQLHEELNALLSGDKSNKFDLSDVATKAKQSLKNTIKNADELSKAERDVDRYITAEIKRYGKKVNAETMNNIKQGMWSVGYNQLRPTAKKTARQIGYIAKDQIEKAFVDNDIRALNSKSGDYLTLIDLLDNAQGRVIKGGRLGGYFARATGTIAGGLAGQVIPIPGFGPAVGAVAGGEIGARIAAGLSDPVRRSLIASGKMQKALAGKPSSFGKFRNPTLMINPLENPLPVGKNIVGAKMPEWKRKAFERQFGKFYPYMPKKGK